MTDVRALLAKGTDEMNYLVLLQIRRGCNEAHFGTNSYATHNRRGIILFLL